MVVNVQLVLVMIIVKMIQLIVVVKIIVKVMVNVQLVYMIHQKEYRVKVILVLTIIVQMTRVPVLMLQIHLVLI
jgi:hypothetical protein